MPRGWELVFIALVFLLLFGYKRLPDATRSLGRSLRIFKAETRGLRDDDSDERSQDASDRDDRPRDPSPRDAPVQARAEVLPPSVVREPGPAEQARPAPSRPADAS